MTDKRYSNHSTFSAYTRLSHNVIVQGEGASLNERGHRRPGEGSTAHRRRQEAAVSQYSRGKHLYDSWLFHF